MNDNPYSTILELTESNKQRKDNVMVGIVTSASPLIVRIGDLPVYKDDMLIADYLSNGCEVGDRLAVLQTGDKQLYIIIARVKEV